MLAWWRRGGVVEYNMKLINETTVVLGQESTQARQAPIAWLHLRIQFIHTFQRW